MSKDSPEVKQLFEDLWRAGMLYYKLRCVECGRLYHEKRWAEEHKKRFNHRIVSPPGEEGMAPLRELKGLG